MQIDQQKLERLANLAKCPISLLQHGLSRQSSWVEEKMKTSLDMGNVRLIAKNSGMEPYSAPARIAACHRWLEIEAGNEEATDTLSLLTQEIEIAVQCARGASTPLEAMHVYRDAPEGSEAEKIAIERALQLI